MKKAQEELGTRVGEKFGDELGGRAISAVDRRLSPEWLKRQKKRLREIVHKDANRPLCDLKNLVSSRAFDATRACERFKSEHNLSLSSLSD